MRTALASWPRSGNTWLRQMIETATGEKTGSVYRHNSAVMEDGTTEGLVVKTHELEWQKFDRAIYLVRSPYDAIWSFYHWRRDINGEGALDWDEHVMESLIGWRNWPDHTRHWMAAEIPVLRMTYEGLLRGTEPRLNTCLHWLGYDVPPKAIKEAVKDASLEVQRCRYLTPKGQAFFRRGVSGEGRWQFNEAQVQEMATHCGALMLEWGYEV